MSKNSISNQFKLPKTPISTQAVDAKKNTRKKVKKELDQSSKYNADFEFESFKEAEELSSAILDDFENRLTRELSMQKNSSFESEMRDESKNEPQQELEEINSLFNDELSIWNCDAESRLEYCQSEPIFNSRHESSVVIDTGNSINENDKRFDSNEAPENDILNLEVAEVFPLQISSGLAFAECLQGYIKDSHEQETNEKAPKTDSKNAAFSNATPNMSPYNRKSEVLTKDEKDCLLQLFSYDVSESKNEVDIQNSFTVKKTDIVIQFDVSVKQVILYFKNLFNKMHLS